MFIYRVNYNGIIFEFLPSKGNRGIVVLCDGLPSVPKQKNFMYKLAEDGFSVVYPRYRGTWESEGVFLDESPVKDIQDLLVYLKKGKLVEAYSNQEILIDSSKIFLLGASFGATIAMALLDDSRVEKVIAISPVIDIKKHNDSNDEQDLLFLFDFMKKVFPGAYRFNKLGIDNLLEGKLLSNKNILNKEESSKLFIVFGEADEVVSPKKIEDYCLLNSVGYIKEINLGHLSFSCLSDGIYKKIKDVFLK